MGREINRLSAQTAKTLTKRGRHADGGGLYLSISPNGGRRWVFLYRWHGKPTEVGLGSARDVTLAKARDRAKRARDNLVEGLNPKAARKSTANSTFGECADCLHEAMRPSWRNAKHAAQWKTTVNEYAAPLLRLPVDQITTDDVLSALKPLWNNRPETASRVRGRIERVLDAAKAQGLRSGENPARWRGHLDQLLPASSRVRAVQHYAAMPYADLPGFMDGLRSRETVTARALELTILTAARTGDVLGMKWSELDFDKAVWTVPAERMKSGREHKVPLSPRALKLVKAMEGASDKFVFPGRKPDKPLTTTTLFEALHATKVENVTVHGFRSTFRDWAAEETAYPNHVVEKALAHSVGDKVEAAYRRGDLFEKRRKLMEAWSTYCTTPKVGKVIAFKR